MNTRRFKANVYGTKAHENHYELLEWSIDTRNFEIILSGEIISYKDDHDVDRSEPGVEYQMSARLLKNLRILSAIDKTRPILIHMKTCGGDWQDGMAMFDMIRSCPNPIVILSYTHARSMSSIILQAADRRVLMPHSYFLFHDGTIGVPSSSTNKQFHTFAEWDKNIVRPTMLSLYVWRLKQKGRLSRRSPESIRKTLTNLMDKKEDVYITSTEAVNLGFADGIFEGDYDKIKRFSKKLPRKEILNFTPNFKLDIDI